ncbi:hypothetical protein F442_18710 [Phytophthora nicotianae P10297]|uniref:Uncharacterized protein n=1 Tax=Phytophthora nicotianae P10297 TaxID=1317064 RepID=W2YC94_PHYNI|nr:hypothetical protein F442_18710 [Phytophthora nicotianae P10297]
MEGYDWVKLRSESSLRGLRSTDSPTCLVGSSKRSATWKTIQNSNFALM